MKFEKKAIIGGVEKKIIESSGNQTSSETDPFTELKQNKNKLYSLINVNNDIRFMLFMDMEIELIKLLNELTNKQQSAETELQMFFKRLYNFFAQNSFYLSLIFDNVLKDKDPIRIESLFRIKNMVEMYLTKLTNEGKRENVFKTKHPTKDLVNGILISFRSLMEDEHRFNEMIQELKTLKTKLR